MGSHASLMVASAALAARGAAGSEAETRQVTFDEQKAGEPPAGFTCGLTGRGCAGAWRIVEDATAPTRPNALGQVDEDNAVFAATGKRLRRLPLRLT